MKNSLKLENRILNVKIVLFLIILSVVFISQGCLILIIPPDPVDYISKAEHRIIFHVYKFNNVETDVDIDAEIKEAVKNTMRCDNLYPVISGAPEQTFLACETQEIDLNLPWIYDYNYDGLKDFIMAERGKHYIQEGKGKSVIENELYRVGTIVFPRSLSEK